MKSEIKFKFSALFIYLLITLHYQYLSFNIAKKKNNNERKAQTKALVDNFLESMKNLRKRKTSKYKKNNIKIKLTNKGHKNIVNYGDLRNLDIKLSKTKTKSQLNKNKSKKENVKQIKNMKENKSKINEIKNKLKTIQDDKLILQYKKGIYDTFTEDGIEYFPYLIKSKDEKTNSFPNQVNTKIDSKNILNFAMGFAVGFGLNAEANNDLVKCFNNSPQRVESVENFISETSKLSTTVVEAEKSNNSFLSLMIGLFSTLKCDSFKRTVFSFLKNKLISWGIKGLLYVTTGPVGLLVKMGYDIVKLGIEVSNYKKALLENPIDYTTLGSTVGRICYYFQDLFFRKKRRI